MEGIEKELDREALIALVLELRGQLAQLREENARLRRRIEELEGKGATRRPAESYSLRAEEQRRERAADGGGRKQRRRQKSVRRGRRKTDEKLDAAERVCVVLPEGLTIAECTPLRERPVWRIENGRAVRVAYDIYRGPRGQLPQIEGVLPRSEYGLEIHVSVAFLVLVVGLSMDKVCGLLKFFWNLELSKSQADAMLSQLSRAWEREFESLCQLLAVSAVVHADETSWSIHSVWALLSEQARLLVFGCHKDAQTLEVLLPKETFAGILVSDDAAVYRGFSKSQKCWAHLVRKAIRLTLLEPASTEYRQFLDGLLEVYRTACRFAADRRLSQAGRLRKVDELTDRMCVLCGDRFADESEPADDIQRDFVNLVHELVRLLGDDELFTFVRHPQASGTNNEAERTLRGPALDRRTGRTSKTLRGARRRTILVSVFESLRVHLAEFTLPALLQEISIWSSTGTSLFDRLLRSSGLAPPETSTLANLLPSTP